MHTSDALAFRNAVKHSFVVRHDQPYILALQFLVKPH